MEEGNIFCVLERKLKAIDFFFSSETRPIQNKVMCFPKKYFLNPKKASKQAAAAASMNTLSLQVHDRH